VKAEVAADLAADFASAQAVAGLNLADSARRLAGGQDAAEGHVDGELHVRVPGVAQMAHRRRQIRRTDEHAVHAIRRLACGTH
jgi:type IV secretory pathway TrbL component